MKVNREKDKELLTQIKDITKCSTKVTKDECGDYNLIGKKGKIYSDGVYWYLMIYTQAWSLTKEKLGFMEVWKDHGQVLRLNRLPSSKEGTLIRKYAGLGKKRVMSDKQKEHMKKFFFKPRSQTIVSPSPID